MGLFSKSLRNNSEDAEHEERAAPIPPTFPPAPDVNDPAAMREYIAKRLLAESEIAETPAQRVAALKTLADITAVTAETKFRVERRLVDSTTNIVVVQEALRDARARSRGELTEG